MSLSERPVLRRNGATEPGLLNKLSHLCACAVYTEDKKEALLTLLKEAQDACAVNDVERVCMCLPLHLRPCASLCLFAPLRISVHTCVPHR
jgi:hypothetical protein